MSIPCNLTHAIPHPPTVSQIMWSSAILTICGNCVVFPTILGFFVAFDSEDDAGYSMW